MGGNPSLITTEQLQGIIVVGIDDIEVLHAYIRQLPPFDFGYTPPIYLVEQDIERARHAVITLGIGTDPRFRGCFGPNAGRELVSQLRSRMHEIAIPERVVTCGSHDPNLVSWIEDSVSSLRDEQRAVLASWFQQIEQRAQGRDRVYWTDRFNAIESGQSAKILIIATRFSTFMQHASDDLAHALQSLGHEVLVLKEPDAYTMFTPQYTVGAQVDFDPDMVVTTNYPRAMRDESFPAGAVNVCWIQDAMAHLFEPLPMEVAELDFIVGSLVKTAAAIEAYPPSRRLHEPIPVSEYKFHPETPIEEHRRAYACDIAYISHQSGHPDQLHEQLIQSWDPSAHSTIEALREVVDQTVESWPTEIVEINRRLFLRDMIRAYGDLSEQDQLKLWHQYVQPMIERSLRHMMLEWAASIAKDHRLSMRLYGRGWDSHPTLSAYASGELAHDDSLRSCYQLARVQLHASSYGAGHQRQYECAMSGGFMLSLRSWREFLRENRVRIGSFLNSDAQPDACLLATRTPCYSLRNHPDIHELMVERRRMPIPPRGWDHTADSDVFACLPDEPAHPNWDEMGLPMSTRSLRILGDAYSMTFSTKAELEERVLRACRDDAWRRELSGITRVRALEHVSFSRFADTLMRFLGDSVRESAHSKREVLA